MIEAESIKQKAKIFSNKIISIRRHLHSHPELSFKEFNTSIYIKSLLNEFGIEYKDGFVKTGIVAEIKGKNPETKIIALRADMDALPIREQNKTEYKSLNDGVMHACGHDVHMSCMLGAIIILNELREELEGTIKFVFQPGEEVLPGGAKLMLEENLFGNKLPNAIIAQHVFPSMETGKVGFRNGMYMASTDEIYITVVGKGGHAAMPSEYCNPILIASKILMELQKEFMENKNIDENGNEIPCVLAFGKINGAGATNIIPEKVSIEGTFRTMNEGWRAASHEKIINVCNKLANEYGAKAEVKIINGYPFLENDESTTNICRDAAIYYLGKENVEELPLRMTAEDFAWFSQQIPSCFYRLGTGNKTKGIVSGVHSPTFDIDEDALEIGSGLMAWLAISLLKN
ncbi:MAG: M20 family metallopeptidase [Bacteroidota bacterium]|jgi:amidohydrolase